MDLRILHKKWARVIVKATSTISTKLIESEEITTLEGVRLERAKGIIEETLSNRGFK